MKTIKTLVMAAAVFGCSHSAMATAAVDMFLKLDDIKGESTQRGFEGAIEIDAFSWGATNTGGGGGPKGSGGSAGRVNIQDFHFTKFFDAASPRLFLHCCNGKIIKEAKLTVRTRPSGDTFNAAAPQRPEGDFMVIIFKEVQITKINEDGDNANSQGYLAENIAISFSSVEIIYTPYGAKEGEVTRSKWDLKTNK